PIAATPHVFVLMRRTLLSRSCLRGPVRCPRGTLARPPDGSPESRRIARVRSHRQAPQELAGKPRRAVFTVGCYPFCRETSMASKNVVEKRGVVEFTKPPKETTPPWKREPTPREK